MRIGIVGGGAAGLMAAYRLCQAGHQAVVFEAEPELGGQGGTFPIAGTRLERFYHHFFHSDRIAFALLEELGLSNRLLWAPDRSAYFWGGCIYLFVTPMDLLRFRPLSWPSRFIFGLQTAYLLFGANWQPLERITAREWLLRWGTREVYNRVWGALLRSKFGDYADRVSMAWLWGKLHARRGKSLRGRKEALAYLDGSFQILFNALAERITDLGGEIHTATPALRVLVKDGTAQGLRVSEGGRAVDYPFDAVILTVASPIAFRLAPDLPAEYATLLRQQPYEGTMTLVLALDRSLIPCYWLSIPEEDIPMVVAVEHTHFVPPKVYRGRHIVYFGRYLPSDSPEFAWSKEEVLKHYTPYIQRLNPLFDPGWVVESWLFKDPYGQPVIEPGYSARIPPHQTPIANLYLANTTQIYPEDRGVNYSLLLGEVIAKIVQGTSGRASLLW